VVTTLCSYEIRTEIYLKFIEIFIEIFIRQIISSNLHYSICVIYACFKLRMKWLFAVFQWKFQMCQYLESSLKYCNSLYKNSCSVDGWGWCVRALKNKQELSSDGRPFGHNRHGPKWGGAAVGAGSPLDPHLTQCGLGWGLPLFQVAYLDPSNRFATTVGMPCSSP